MPHSRRHSIQSVSIPPSTPTTNFSRSVNPSLPKYSELRFVDPPRTHQSEFLYSHQQPIYSTPKTFYDSKPQTSFTPQIPEIRVSPTFTPTLVSRDVQTDKPTNSFFNQSFGSVDPGQISGIGLLSQTSTQTLPQFSSQFPNQFSSQFSHQVTPSPQIDISQYLYTPSLPKTSDLGSRTEFRGLSRLENTSRVFGNTSPTPSYPDYSWRYPKSTRFEEKSPGFKKNSIFERNSILDKNPTYEKNSRFEDKTPPRFFRRFDFNTTFRRNDRPLPSSRDILSSTRTKPSLKSFKLSTGFKSDYDVYERSRKMDNELDRYIGKIRNLHKDMDLQSLEDLDHEQNTSGDLLNVTLSDDDVDLPVEEKGREKRLSKKGDMPEVFGKHLESEELTPQVPNTYPVTQSDVPVSETGREVSLSESNEKSDIIPEENINSGIAKGGIEVVVNSTNNADLTKVNENRVLDESKTSVFGELISGNDISEAEFNGLKETEVDQKTDDEEKKSVVDEKIVAENNQEKVDEESKERKILEGSQEESNKMEGEKKEDQGKEVEYKNNQYVQDPNQEYQYDSNQDYNYDPNAGYEQYPGYSNEGYDQYNQQYDPNQQYSQDPSQYPEGAEQYSADPSQQYDPNQQYDLSQYVQDPNQQYEQDPNQVYDPNQQYQQDPSQQYAQDPSQEYVKDPNQEYVQDPNQKYVQDPNQQYAQEPSQYDPNQQYQDPNVQYDPNQAYDYSQSQGYSEHDQTYNSDQPYDENYPSEPAADVVKVESEKVEDTAQEEKANLVEATSNKKKEVTLESDTESTIERNASNTESDFDFN